MVYERTGIIAIVIGIALIITIASLISLPAKSNPKDLWSYDTMREELLNAKDKAKDVIEIEKAEIKTKLRDLVEP